MVKHSKISLFLLSFLAITGILIGTYLYFQGNKPQTINSRASVTQLSESPSPSGEITGYLHISGKDLFDENNTPVRLTGVNIATLGTTQWHRFVQSPPFYDFIKSSGFNFVRFTISWGDMEPNPPAGVTHTYDQTYIQTVDSAINNFKSRGIKVLLDMTQSGWSSAVTSGGGGYGMPAWLYPPSSNPTHPGQPWGDRDAKRDFFVNGRGQDGYIAALSFMTKRYKDDPTVFAVDMMNEPYSITPTLMPQDMHLNAFYLKVGTAIRATNPNITLVYQDSSIKGAIDKGGADPEADLALTGPLTLPNSIYETHLYDKDWIPDGKAVADLFLTRVNRWNVPALIGEFNGFGQAGNGADLTQSQATELAAFMTYMKQSRINWSYFQFQSGKTPIVNGTNQQPEPLLLRTLQDGMSSPNPILSPSPNPTFSTSPTPTVPPGSSPTPPPGQGVNLTLKLAFQGIVSSQAAGKTMNVAVTVAHAGMENQTKQATFATDGTTKNSFGNLIWTGSVNFSSLEPGDNYTVFVKGPKQLKKKVCDNAPTETVGGAYSCGLGKITLSASTDLDFSGILLLAGDLPDQNGFVDSYDLSFLRNNLNSRDPAVVAVGDVNLDGIVDSQDYSIVLSSLQIKSDEQ